MTPIIQPERINTGKASFHQVLLLLFALFLMISLALLPQWVPTARGSDICVANEILFIGGDRPLPEQDQLLRFYLLALGQQVTVRSGDEVSSADTQGKALIIISESVESSTINTKFREIDVPIVTWEGWLQDDLGMTADGSTVVANVDPATVEDKDEGAYGETLRQTSILIITPTHPLAAGYSGEVKTVVNRSNKFHWGVPNENAVRVAQQVDEAGHTMIYAYEKGAAMVGLTAPARRVFLHNATGPSLTTAGLSLFLNAVYWAMDCLEESSTPTVTPTDRPPNTSTATTTTTATPLPTATGTPTFTTTPTPTPTASATATAEATITPTPSISGTATATQSAPSTPTVTATATATPSATEAVPTATATTPPSAAQISVDKSDLLFNDADEDGQVSRGDTLLYIIQVQNHGNNALLELVVEDQLDINTPLIPGSVQSSRGIIDHGNSSGDTHISVMLDTLTAQTSMQVSFQVLIEPTSTVALVVNQATVRFVERGSTPSGQQQRSSNDPDTSAPDDATLTPLGSSAVQSIFLPVIVR